MQSLADIEIAGVVDIGPGAQGSAFLVILLDAGSFVIHMEGGSHPVGDHPVRNKPGVREVTRRSKRSCTCLGRPRSRFSGITSSKKMRPGRSRTWVRKISIWRMERSLRRS